MAYGVVVARRGAVVHPRLVLYPAHGEDVAYSFFAPNVGVVAMISQEDVEAFWIIHIDTTIGQVLAAQ